MERFEFERLKVRVLCLCFAWKVHPLLKKMLHIFIGGPLEQSDLQSKDSFIIDNGAFGLWVWVGKKASSAERTEAMRNAQGFIKKKGNHLCSTLILKAEQVRKILDEL